MQSCTVVGPGEGGGSAVFPGASGIGAQVAESVNSDFQIQVSAGGAQDYGVFLGRAQVLVDVPYSTPGTFYGGGSSGSARDTWTITSPGQSGPGSLKAFFDVRGAVTVAPDSGGAIDANLRLALTAGNPVYAAGSTGPIVAGGEYGFENDGSIPFTFGAPFPIEMVSNLVASVASPSGGAGYFASAIVDFSGGAFLSRIEVYDGQGQPVEAFALTTESGRAYPVPEPTAGASAIAALLALARRARAS